MSTRLFIVIALAAVSLAGFVWLTPVAGLLSSPGYALQQITRPLLGSPALTEAPDPVRQPPGDRAERGGAGAAPTDQATEERPANGRDKPAAPAPDDRTDPPPQPTRLTSSSTVNVRDGRGTEFEVVGQVAPGETVVVSEDTGGDWVRIRGDDVRGWVSRPLFVEAGQ